MCNNSQPKRGFPYVNAPPIGGFLRPPAMRVEFHSVSAEAVSGASAYFKFLRLIRRMLLH